MCRFISTTDFSCTACAAVDKIQLPSVARSLYVIRASCPFTESLSVGGFYQHRLLSRGWGFYLRLPVSVFRPISHKPMHAKIKLDIKCSKISHENPFILGWKVKVRSHKTWPAWVIVYSCECRLVLISLVSLGLFSFESPERTTVDLHHVVAVTQGQ